MVRATGWLSDEKSLIGPTSAPLSCVVRRIRGNSVKRINGTASSAPTQKDPSASKAPRNERRFSETGPELSGFVIITALLALGDSQSRFIFLPSRECRQPAI